MISVVCAVIGLLGPGALSVDRLFGIAVAGPLGLAIVIGVGVIGAAVLLAATWRPTRSLRR
jgi:putative oxidoreductase